jgi:hypothetical protein
MDSENNVQNVPVVAPATQTSAKKADKGLAKADLKKVNLNDQAEIAREFQAPQLVNYDNGTQSFDETETQKVTHPEIVQGAYAQNNADPRPTYVDNVETPVVMREKRVIQEALTSDQFQAFMDKEEASRPTVFADRKADYEKQMQAIKDRENGVTN